MSGLDQTLERIYRRLGSRIIVGCQALNFAYGLLFGYTFALEFARVKQASTGKTLVLCGIWAAEFVACGVLATIVVLRAARPLTDWIDGDRRAETAEAAWRTGMRLPVITARRYAIAALVFAPVHAVLIDLVEPARAAVLPGYVFGWLLGLGPIIAGSMFTTKLAVRPLLREVAESLTTHPVPTGGISVRMRLVAIAPALLLPPLVWGIGVTTRAGTDLTKPLGGILLGTGMVLVLGVPLALLIAYSTLQPLDDLLRAAEQLKSGDLTTRVPELSADEHGVLAHSFNQAIEGLAERERLAQENKQLLEEVTASRARIIAASDAERRRIERNIHDGAQQRLLALALKLRMLEERVAENDGLRTAVENAGDALQGALGELRELARGLHPSVLATDGLRPALKQLAARSSLAVSVNAPTSRFPGPIESAAYFVACEGLTNVVKHAVATCAQITVEQRNGSVIVEVADDGRGGANAETGTGLAGLVDRIAALNGRLTVSSAHGAGTRLVAEIPL